MAAMVIFSFQNRPYASRHHIDCRRGDAFFVAKSPSRNVISIGWRRYLMAADHLSNHKLMIVVTEKAYACISPALRIATCMLGRRGRVAAGRSLLEASPSFRAAVTNSGLTSLVVALTSRVGECKCGGTGARETLIASHLSQPLSVGCRRQRSRAKTRSRCRQRSSSTDLSAKKGKSKSGS